MKCLQLAPLIIFAIVLPISSVLAQRTFVHPGSLHKQSDLDRMKYMVETRAEPYLSTFKKLQAFPKASYDYEVQGDLSKTNTKEGGFTSDATAAYLNSLMWYITEDERHAEKCIEIFNSWVNLTQSNGFALRSGNDPWKMVEGAEIIRSTYNGWAEEDIEKFKAMLVYPGYSTTEIPEGSKTFYWNIVNGDPHRHGNQDAIAFRAMISIAVFLDNEIMYDRALRYYMGLPHRPDDIPYASGPGISTQEISDNPYHTIYKNKRQSSEEDYGYNGVLEHYFWENGQCQESSRDQQHTYFGLSICQMLSEVAWNQGDPVWNYLDNRLLKAFEFSARYNTSYIQSYPDQPEPWEPTVQSGEFIERMDRTGRWKSKAINPYYDANTERISRGKFIEHRPIYEQAYAHFDVRMGQGEQAVWTKRSRDLVKIEGNGWSNDHPGWGGLTFRRPQGCAGDPISGFESGVPVFSMHVLPGKIEAENYDYFPMSGQGRTYYDTSKGNRNGYGKYRKDDVDITPLADGGYAITELERGEWTSYSVHVTEAGNYDFSIRYAAKAEGAILFYCNGRKVSEVITLPVTEGVEMETFTVARNVPLEKGVQSLRIIVSDGSSAYMLDRFSVEASGSSLAAIEEVTQEPVTTKTIEAPAQTDILPLEPAPEQTDMIMAEDDAKTMSVYLLIAAALGLLMIIALMKGRRK